MGVLQMDKTSYIYSFYFDKQMENEISMMCNKISKIEEKLEKGIIIAKINSLKRQTTLVVYLRMRSSRNWQTKKFTKNILMFNDRLEKNDTP